MTTPNDALVVSEAEAFNGLALSTDQLFELKSLMDEVRALEALRGKNALDLGARLRKIRDLLGNVPATSGQSAWGKWCDTFMYTRDYAARLIQIAEVFETVNGADQLSIRHMREIARISDGTTSVERLVDVVNEHGLGVHEIRKLVTDANQGNLNIAELIDANPNLKAEIDRRIREAKKDSKEKHEQLQAKLREIDAEKLLLAVEKTELEENTRDLQKQLKVEVAAVKLGEGNPEVGRLIIQLEQTNQEKDNALLSLDQIQKTLRKVQTDHERWVNSSAGQVKIDFRKLIDDTAKFFKDTMAPAYVAMRVSRVNTEESRAEMLKLVEVVEQWAQTMRTALVTPTQPTGIEMGT